MTCLGVSGIMMGIMVWIFESQRERKFLTFWNCGYGDVTTHKECIMITTYEDLIEQELNDLEEMGA
jgi:hypothetical protein